MNLLRRLWCILLDGHQWEYWHKNVDYRYCKYCGAWQYEWRFSDSRIVGTWVNTQKPKGFEK